MKESCSMLVLKVANYYQIAAELAELRALIEDFLQRSNANLDLNSQHKILFPFDSLRTLKVHLEKLQAAEVSDGWRSCVKKCVVQNLRATNRGDDRSLDAMSDHRSPTRVLQPESVGMLAWETLILVIIYTQFIMVPFVLSYRTQRHEVFYEFVAELFLFLDILVRFNLAYFAPPIDWNKNYVPDLTSDGITRPSTNQKPVLVQDRRRIALHYVSSHVFYIDVLSTSPIIISIAVLVNGRSNYKYAAVKLLKYVRVFKVEQMMNVSRKLPHYAFQQHARRSSRYISLLKLAGLLLGIAITMHILACIWHIITPQDHWELRYNQYNEGAEFLSYSNICRRQLYLMSYYEAILILMGEQIAMSHVKEYVFAIISTVLFSFLLAIIFGEVAMFIANFNELPFAYSRKMSELHETMSSKFLPRVLQDRVYAFYDFLWKDHKTLNGKLEIVQFLPELTSNLATEVRLFWCKDLLLNVPFFQLFPPSIVQCLVIAVDIKFYMPDDYIIVASEVGHEMYFLKKGNVDIFRVHETEIEISDEFLMPRSPNGMNSQIILDENKRHAGRSFMSSAKSTTRSISTGVKTAALHGVSTVKQAMPARKRYLGMEVEATTPPHLESRRTDHHHPTDKPTEGILGRQPNSQIYCAPSLVSATTASEESNRISGDGSSSVVRVRRMQREQILKTLQPGDFFGEIALVTCCPRTATVKARSFVECAIIQRRDFEGMLVDHPQKLVEALGVVRSHYNGANDTEQKYNPETLTNPQMREAGTTASCPACEDPQLNTGLCNRLLQLEISIKDLGDNVIRRSGPKVHNRLLM
jgi:CRP-like cAMP-binding protein